MRKTTHRKRYLAGIAVLLLLSMALAGCGSNKLLDEFTDKLTAQESVDLELFLENYSQARDLLASGVKPKGSLPVYDPASGDLDPAGDLAQSGLYAVKLDPAVYGVSNYYVIPAGERPMTAEEYLELAQMSGLTGPELVMAQNSWLSFQYVKGDVGNTRGIRENRNLSQKERFWQMFQYYETIRNGETEQQLVKPITVYVDTAEPQPFFLLPTSDMDESSLRGYIVAYMESIPADGRAALLPAEEDISWEEAVAAAKAAMAEHAGRADEPIKDYVAYAQRESPFGNSSYWEVALYYADGSSYSVQVMCTGEIRFIHQMENDIYDYGNPWTGPSPGQTVKGMIYPQQ